VAPTDGSEIDLGELTHFNFPTQGGTAASSSRLRLDLRLTDAAEDVFDEPFPVAFTIEETANAEPCQFPSDDPCADRVGLTAGAPTFTKRIGTPYLGDEYRLTIVGFKDTPLSSPSTQFISQEGGSTTKTLFATLTKTAYDERLEGSVDFVLGPAVYGDAPRELVATGDGGAVTYTASGACSVSGATLTFTGAGPCAVTATRAADGTYRASEATRSITVARAPLTARADDKAMVLGDPVPPLTGTLTGVVNGDDLRATFTTAADGTQVGRFPIRVNVTGAGLGNYALTAIEGTLSVRYPFDGFFRPVDNEPTVNAVNAGRAIPMKFSLGGDRGLGIFADGSPTSRRIDCASGAPTDDVEETVTAGGSSLQYTGDHYTYVWKTSSTWAGQCRQFVMTLADGTSHTATFRFR
jgi:hypothetical protein